MAQCLEALKLGNISRPKGVTTIDISKVTMQNAMLQKVEENRKHNEIISKYYYYNQKNALTGADAKQHMKRGLKVFYCNKRWDIDWYVTQGIKDYKKTYLCHDKFCMNCKKLKQAIRIAKFVPVLEQHENLYHIVLTVPNVPGTELKFTIKNMFSSFKQLIRYLNGNDKIVGLDFGKWQYEGALRSLEVTFNPYDYHPHVHVVMKLNGITDIVDRKRIQNTYSIDYRSGQVKRLFSDEEVLLQKVWRLLIDGQRVSWEAVENLTLGYSCMIDPICNDDYYELFKYVAKGDGRAGQGDSEEDNYYMSYKNFADMWSSLHKTRQIQGYGCFYNMGIDEEEEEMLINQMDIDYDEFIESLKKNETPVFARQSIQELLDDSSNTLISRKRYLDYLKELYRRD